MFLDKFFGKVRKFERHSYFGVGVITILPEGGGGGSKSPHPSLNKVNSPFGLRRHGLLTQSPFGLEELLLNSPNGILRKKKNESGAGDQN